MPRFSPPAPRTFEEVADRFTANIYGKPKGQLRLNLLWRDLQDNVLSRFATPPRVLDIGGGAGHMAARLARYGCEVTLLEPSSSMLAQAASYFEQQAVAVQCVQGELSSTLDLGRFDVLVCHAVLEWVATQADFLSALAARMKPDGYLSLAYYNLNGLIMRNMIKGNLRKLETKQFAGFPGSLTPTQPVDPHWLSATMNELGWTRQSRRGIRIFYDYIPIQRQETLALDDVERLEWQFGNQEPWRDIGRYVHDIFVRHADAKIV